MSSPTPADGAAPQANEVLVARQPILRRDRAPYAYELLYRSSWENAFDGAEALVATSRLINHSFLTIGIEKLSSGRPVFINFDRQMLLEGFANLLPPAAAVVEILETVPPDPEVLAACRGLKKRGFLLALDDFTGDARFAPLIELSDIIKVDFQLTSPAQQREILRRYAAPGRRFLAEKVETREQFDAARRLGYHYFQGYFFSRPVIIAGKEIPGFKLNYLRVLKEISNPDLDFDRLEEILLYEASLVHKLLRYINSAQFNLRGPVDSIRHALALLGEEEIRKWVSLIVIAGLAGDKPTQLVIDAMVRARFLEQLARRIGLAARRQELFLLGLFSLLDAILDRPLETIVAEVHLREDVRGALLGEPTGGGRLAEALALARGYEAGDWALMESSATAMELPAGTVANAYLEAAAWADAVFRS